MLAAGHNTFCAHYLLILNYILTFQSENFTSYNIAAFLGLLLDTVGMSVSLPSGKLLEIQQLALSLLQKKTVSVHQVMVLGKNNFCANGHA